MLLKNKRPLLSLLMLVLTNVANAQLPTDSLLQASVRDVFLHPQSSFVKKNNVALDSLAGTVLLPVKPGANLRAFNPEFFTGNDVSIEPPGPQNFLKGPVDYRVSLNGKLAQNVHVTAKEFHNPVLDGYYADPEILYSEKTGKFYLYPTTDGFKEWSGTYFKAFSSSDLLNWKDEGVILELSKDVKWAKIKAWAPCIVEKKIKGNYRYYYYFVAEKKLGVATANDPLGPFTDAGKPLIEDRPEGLSRGSQIDPDVFTDPVSGKTFLYWGNYYLAGAELAEDMVSVKKETTKLFTPDSTYREGTYVFYRKGKYYFMWSENDTRDENYRVRYGTADSPLGPIKIPTNNVVIAKNAQAGIYATGHNSVLQIPGRDEWYIVYHRFAYPKGIKMGRDAGYHREVCIDKLAFNRDGSIKQVVPTQEGIKGITLNRKAQSTAKLFPQ